MTLPTRWFLIWSWKHEQWWRPEAQGYTSHVSQAGRYNEAQAAAQVVGHIPPGEEVAVDEVWASKYGRPPVFGAPPTAEDDL